MFSKDLRFNSQVFSVSKLSWSKRAPKGSWFRLMTKQSKTGIIRLSILMLTS
ncbi:hypothetical protein IV54_GL001905 [Levilactobacillus paucivorans]|uniref:Uncharacterized protein n=1 Tax=Levilactobacillus paucivorans TaxID=616990 RepID=A0A0R2LQI4_9LACO|nr:hypothetical protein IV54_GL001905 [Levilactobacillus paucivorans]